MMTQHRVITWIENLSQICSHKLLQDVDTPASAAGKHKRNSPVRSQERSRPSSSPILSIHTDGSESLNRKRQPLNARADLEQITCPQYETSNEHLNAPPSRPSASAPSRTRSTSTSKRKFMELRLDEGGLETKALTVNSLEALPNPEAASLLRTMRRIGNCKGILPQDLRDRILQSHNIRQDDLDDWDLAFKESDGFAHLPGRIPSARETELVFYLTTDCIESCHEEAGWKDQVHLRLLRAIFRDSGEKTGGLFNITTSCAPRPHKHRSPRSTGSKMVDFRVYAYSTQQNTKTAKLYEDFCRTTPTRSVNHIDFQTHSIVLSIETKAGSNSDAAELQIGVWHAAQWAFLKSPLLRAQDGACSIEQQTERVGQALSRLRFIPAVIVQGHRWIFVLSTRQGQKTILWKEYQFGSTSTVVETYQVVAGLRQLAGWADQAYDIRTGP